MTFEVLTTRTCRWSIRNISALIEKGADFRLIDVADAHGKAAWYTAVTPFGKTPALRHAARIVVESLQINEYVESVAQGRSLLPAEPFERAWSRIWSAYCDQDMMSRLSLAATGPGEQRERALRELGTNFETLDEHLFRYARPGVFWGGVALSLTDISYWSLFDVLDRVEVLEPAKRLLESHPRLAEWGRNLLAYPAFLEAVAHLELLEAH